jgi:hypothetical protein
VTPNDVQLPADFIGSGWRFPLHVNSRGGIDLTNGDDEVRASIVMILSTPIGERRMRPRFGCGIHDLVFAANSPATHGLIAYHVSEALALWEPRIELRDDGVRVRVDPDNPGSVRIEINYLLRATNQPRNLVYPFYLIPSEPEP